MLDNILGYLEVFGKSHPKAELRLLKRISAYLAFPLSVVDLEVDVADGEAAVPLHHCHAVLAREEAHRLKNVKCHEQDGTTEDVRRKRPSLDNLVEILKVNFRRSQD